MVLRYDWPSCIEGSHSFDSPTFLAGVRRYLDLGTDQKHDRSAADSTERIVSARCESRPGSPFAMRLRRLPAKGIASSRTLPENPFRLGPAAPPGSYGTKPAATCKDGGMPPAVKSHWFIAPRALTPVVSEVTALCCQSSSSRKHCSGRPPLPAASHQTPMSWSWRGHGLGLPGSDSLQHAPGYAPAYAEALIEAS